MVIHAPPLVEAIGEPTETIDNAAAGSDKPIVAVMLGSGNGPLLPGSPIPSFRFPEQAAFVLGRIADYSDWRRNAHAQPAELDPIAGHIDVASAAEVIAAHIGKDDPPPEIVASLLECYGVTMASGRLVPSQDAAAVAVEIGFPVAVKAVHRRIGRTMSAGVALDLTSADDVAAAVETMHDHLGDDAARVIVQRMAPPGVDIRVRVHDDPRVGPVISVGLGGLQAAAIADEQSRLAPVSRSDAAGLVAATCAAAALDEIAAEQLAGLVVRVAQLASDHPQIHELDLNPILVNDDGCWVVDATLTLRQSDRTDRGRAVWKTARSR